MHFMFRMIISAFLFASVANAANQVRIVKIDPAPYCLYVQSIEPSLGLDLYGRERVPITLSNGTSWIVTQSLYVGWGTRLSLLRRGALAELIPVGDAVSIRTSLEQERYTWSLERISISCIQAELIDGKENLLAIAAHEEVRLKGSSKVFDVWELSDGSLWASGVWKENSDFYFTRSAWRVGDHVIVSFTETDPDGEPLDAPRFWMLNADYDWYTPAYGGQKYKPYLFIAPISREKYEINID